MNRMNVEFRQDAHKDAAQLEREIDATRAGLQATLEELEHRLSPSELFGQMWSQVRRHGGEFGGNLGQSLKDNPMPALLTSIGIAWMMASNGRHHEGRAAVSGDGDGLRRGRERLRESRERVRERVRGARESMRHRGGSAREGASDARERIAGSAHEVGERARSMSASARYRAHRTRAGFGDMLEEQPLLLGALGLAAGAIAGAALPATEEEDRMLGPTRDRALDRARRSGAEGARRARERAEEAAETTRRAMSERAEDSGHRTEQAGDQSAAPEAPERPTSPSSPGTGPGY